MKLINQKPIKEKSNSLQKKKHRVQGRAWEVIMTPPVDYETYNEFLKKTENGILMSFMTTHVDGEHSHTHCGVILRDTPKRLYLEGLNEYFCMEGHKAVVRPLAPNIPSKGKGSHLRKMKQYYDYTRDERRHDGQTIQATFFFRFFLDEVIALELESVTVAEYVLYYVEEKHITDLKQIAKEATRKRRSDILMKWDKLVAMLHRHIMVFRHEAPTRSIDTFKPAVVAFIKDAWKEGTTLVLQGPTNVGKTELACSLLQQQTSKPACFINDLNMLATRKPGQSVVFDDMNFSKFSRSKGIALTDTAKDRGIRILFGVHLIEAKTPKIFTTNETIQEFMPYDVHGAIVRRISVVDVSQFGKLYME